MPTFGVKNQRKAKALEKSHERELCGAVESTHGEPVNSREMMKRPEEERTKWEEVMDKEFKDFEKRGVWKVKKMSEIPPGRKLIGCKWVHKLKRNGIHRSGLVALGHTQTPGVDYHHFLEWCMM